MNSSKFSSVISVITLVVSIATLIVVMQYTRVSVGVNDSNAQVKTSQSDIVVGAVIAALTGNSQDTPVLKLVFDESGSIGLVGKTYSIQDSTYRMRFTKDSTGKVVGTIISQ